MNTKLPPSEDITLPEIFRRFPDEKSAIEYFETIRWANGVVCPHCGNNDEAKIWSIKGNEKNKVRVGLRQCAVCKKQFRVTVGTIFEDSHIALNLWLVAWYLICGAKKGMSAKQLQRHLGLGSYKSAWFMAHRIRHAMQDPVFNKQLTGTVEVDEAYIGGKNTGRGRGRRWENKTPIVSLVERGGDKRSMVMERVTAHNLRSAIKDNVVLCSNVYTDDRWSYRGIVPKYTHKIVKHTAKEYARREGADVVHTNTVESSFSLIKRGIVGSFHHVSKKHLPLYLAEFDFRWNHRKTTDGERTIAGLGKAEGKRLTLKPLSKKRA